MDLHHNMSDMNEPERKVLRSTLGLAAEMLEKAGVKPTPNRLLVLDALLASTSPMSLIELETGIATLEKSSIFRVLTLLVEHRMVHGVEDGRGIVKYEVCRSEHGHDVSEMHVHFYCEECQRVECFEDITTPRISVPEGYVVESVNYMIKGLCRECAKSRH